MYDNVNRGNMSDTVISTNHSYRIIDIIPTCYSNVGGYKKSMQTNLYLTIPESVIRALTVTFFWRIVKR